MPSTVKTVVAIIGVCSPLQLYVTVSFSESFKFSYWNEEHAEFGLEDLYNVFSQSSLVDYFQVDTAMCHKLVQPGAIWCLLYEGSISVITKHYTAICLALEAVDKYNDADGLLLIFRKTTSYFLGVISSVKLSQGDLR